jgi:hypothetical protein
VVGRSQHLRLVGFELLHLARELGQLLLQMFRLRHKRLGRLLQIGRVELSEVTRDTLFKLCLAPLDLTLREVLVPRVHRLELRTVDGDARFGQQSESAAEIDEARTDLFDGRTVVLAEIGAGLIVRPEPLEEPDHFQIALCLALQAPARLDAVQVAVDVELQQLRGIIARSSGHLRHGPIKTQFSQVERIDEGIDSSDRVALVDPIIEAIGQQCRLPAIRSFHEPLHRSPPQIARGMITDSAFSRSQGHEHAS